MKIRTATFTLVTAAFATFSISACDNNTGDSGDTNVEVSDNYEEGTMIEENKENITSQDTAKANMERYYDRAEGAVHAGDGKGGGVERDNVQ